MAWVRLAADKLTQVPPPVLYSQPPLLLLAADVMANPCKVSPVSMSVTCPLAKRSCTRTPLDCWVINPSTSAAVSESTAIAPPRYSEPSVKVPARPLIARVMFCELPVAVKVYTAFCQLSLSPVDWKTRALLPSPVVLMRNSPP